MMTCTPPKHTASRGGSHSHKSGLSHPEPTLRQIVPVSQGCEKLKSTHLTPNMDMTNHLENSKVFFPAEILLDLGTTSSQGIIQVHGNMNNTVDHGCKERCNCLTS